MCKEYQDTRNQTVVKKYNSKRNQVECIQIKDNLYIRKTMQTSQVLDYEQAVLKQLYYAGVKVPKLLYLNPVQQEIWMEYIEGILLLDWYETSELSYSTGKQQVIQQEVNEVIGQWIRWLDSFYRVTKTEHKQKIISDVNFRNFILKDREIYGIDFELCREGEIEEDIGKIAAFALMYTPQNTVFKKYFANHFVKSSLESWGLDKDLIVQYYEREIEQMKKRRNY